MDIDIIAVFIGAIIAFVIYAGYLAVEKIVDKVKGNDDK